MLFNISACALVKKEDKGLDSAPSTSNEVKSSFDPDAYLAKKNKEAEEEIIKNEDKLEEQRRQMVFIEAHYKPTVGGTVRTFSKNEYAFEVFHKKIIDFCNKYNHKDYDLIKEGNEREFVSYGQYNYYLDSTFICKNT